VKLIVDGPPPSEGAELRSLMGPQLAGLATWTLQKAPGARPTALQIAEHEWVQARHRAEQIDLGAWFASRLGKPLAL